MTARNSLMFVQSWKEQLKNENNDDNDEMIWLDLSTSAVPVFLRWVSCLKFGQQKEVSK